MPAKPAYDVAIIGGGVVGASAACFLAREGARVVLFESSELAAGASGRNSGVLQHPLDPLPELLYHQTVKIYRQLAAADQGFRLDDRPAGLLVLSREEALLRQEAERLGRQAPDLRPELLSAAEAQRLEPGLADGVAACRLETGYPLAPSAATLAFARCAEQAGAELRVGVRASPVTQRGRVKGVLTTSGENVSAAQVLLAAGPWTPELVPGWDGSPPIRPVWGVVVGLALDSPPGHVLEELGIGDRLPMSPALFSLVTSAGQSGVGSIWLEDEPETAAVAAELLRRGATYWPAIENAPVLGVRSCARPTSFDRRPLVGALPDVQGLFVCAGHGPWGISTGPASAKLVARLMLDGQCAELAAVPQLDPARVRPAA